MEESNRAYWSFKGSLTWAETRNNMTSRLSGAPASDVYKRQIVHGQQSSLLGTGQPGNTVKFGVEIPMPDSVSYTHLDVYKRQH